MFPMYRPPVDYRIVILKRKSYGCFIGGGILLSSGIFLMAFFAAMTEGSERKFMIGFTGLYVLCSFVLFGLAAWYGIQIGATPKKLTATGTGASKKVAMADSGQEGGKQKPKAFAFLRAFNNINLAGVLAKLKFWAKKPAEAAKKPPLATPIAAVSADEIGFVASTADTVGGDLDAEVGAAIESQRKAKPAERALTFKDKEEHELPSAASAEDDLQLAPDTDELSLKEDNNISVEPLRTSGEGSKKKERRGILSIFSKLRRAK